jgi:hypothetical protein
MPSEGTRMHPRALAGASVAVAFSARPVKHSACFACACVMPGQ